MRRSPAAGLGTQVGITLFCERCGDELLVAPIFLPNEIQLIVEFCERCEELVREHERELAKNPDAEDWRGERRWA